MEDILHAAIELLESGSDEGCDGLVVVGAFEFHKLRQVIHNKQGVWYGDVLDGEKKNET